MKTVPPNANVVIKEFKVESLNLDKNSLTISLGYLSDKTKAKLTKKLGFDDNIVNFVLATMAEIKQLSGKKIDKEEEMKEKLVNATTRVIREIENLKKIKNAEQYMRAFNKIHCYKINFPDIEI